VESAAAAATAAMAKLMLPVLTDADNVSDDDGKLGNTLVP